MTERDAREAMEQMLEFAERVLGIIHGLTREDLERDQLRLDAIERNLSKLGEASRRVPREVRALHPEIPWADVVGMRSFLIHAYDNIDYDIVWDTVQTDLPPLIEYLVRVLR